jgi:hypothetical protein
MNSSWARLNFLAVSVVILLLLAVIAMQATGVRGGPLDPPAPPGSTDSVREPGTPITSIPLTISQPGKYYLTRNVTSGGLGGLVIATNNVTLDLNGFALSGTNAGTGIEVIPGLIDVMISNGIVQNWSVGISFNNTANVEVTNVHVKGNFTVGIRGGAYGRIADCQVHGNGSAANIQFSVAISVTTSIVENCVVTDNFGPGIRAFTQSRIRNNYLSNNNAGIEVNGNANLVEENMVCNHNGLAFTILGTTANNVVKNNVWAAQAYAPPAYIPLVQYDNVPGQLADHNNVRTDC